jgi:photosystem II stability/assembly factor-like uncharacterized protein
MLRTTDGGLSWIPLGFADYLTSICFAASHRGLAVGGGGTIFRTIDGGATWTRQSSGTTAILNDVYLRDDGTAMIVGNGGTILRTTDGGSHWDHLESGTPEHLTSIVLIDALTATAVGWNGTIIQTTNGGAAWSTIPSGVSWNLERVRFATATDGICVGDYGTILRTSDSGNSWEQILWTHADGDAQITGASLQGFVLAQNYPNPFNPSTTIPYTLPVTSRVRVWITNVLGQDVRRLVDHTQEPGAYATVFDARGLATGVYIYHMEANGFSTTRRMLLVK